MLAIQLIGQFRIHVDGRQVRLASTKASALVAYLAAHEGVELDRAYLARLLWPNSGRREGLHSLSQALYRALVDVHRSAILAKPRTLSLGVAHVDWSQFWQLENVLPLGSSEFLGGLPSTGSWGFEDWRDQERSRLRSALARRHSDKATTYFAAGALVKAARHAAETLDLDATCLDMVRLEFTALSSMQGPTEARVKLSQRMAAASDVLGSEHVLMRQLHELVAENPPASDSFSDLGQVPFVGRTGQMALLTRELQAALGGSGRAIVVAGEEGIGKTRLCHQLLRCAAIRGARILSARCSESEHGVAFAAISRALRGLPATELRNVCEAYRGVIAGFDLI
jgi:hypothetical protein